MIVNATVAIRLSDREYTTESFSFEIPDRIVMSYARMNMGMFTQEEAMEFFQENPPDEPNTP